MLLCLQRKTSIQITIAEALLRRGVLTVEQQAFLKERLWRMMSGFSGEQRADRFWEEIDIVEKYCLFHNFETTNQLGFTHQMDTIFLCPRFVLIIELKNIAGEIMYDERHHQLLRTYNGEQKSLGDPFHQVTRHAEWLEHFLWELGVRNLPVISAVIVTTTSSVLKNMPQQFQVFKLEGLRFKLHQWLKQSSVQVSEPIMMHIRDELLKRHMPRKPKLPFENVRLRKGVLCQCGLKMSYRYGVFMCSCGLRSRDGFQKGLADYRLLVNEWITNRAFCEFFEIEDIHKTSKILQRLNLQVEGARKNRQYYIPENFVEFVVKNGAAR